MHSVLNKDQSEEEVWPKYTCVNLNTQSRDINKVVERKKRMKQVDCIVLNIEKCATSQF